VQPRIILTSHEVQRAAVQPGDHEHTLLAQGTLDIGDRQTRGARANRETHTTWILPLHRQQPLGDGNRIASGLSREQLRCEALSEHRCQYGGE
jgi:hypothetical protein